MFQPDRIRRRHVALAIALVAVVTVSGCSAFASPSAEIRFENATDESGLDYADVGSRDAGKGNAGVYVGDYDGDGWQDVLTVGGEQPALWHNDEGRFERTGALPSVDTPLKSATFTDFDADGDEDVLLFAKYDRPIALENDGGEFGRTDVGIGNLTYPLGAAPADYDGDGDEDLLVYQSGDWSDRKPTGYLAYFNNVPDDNGNPNLLFENVGGEYERVTDEAGLSGARWTLAASFADLTGDGLPDVHAANDYNSDVVYVNQGDGTFERNVLSNSTARNGMSSEVGDFDGDGSQDVYVTNVEIPVDREEMSQARYERIAQLQSFVVKSERTNGNNLLINRGNGSFVDRADEFGVRIGGWGWSASYVDLDNDGDRDVIQATENVVRLDRENPVFTYPMVFERDGDSFSRLDASERGLREDNGRGLATLDYDHDGELEVISANYGSNYTVYDNAVEDGGHSLQFEVVDADGTTAFGATVQVRAGGDATTYRQHSRSDYLSGEGRYRHAGLGTSETADLTVTWPDGTERTFEDVDADRIVRITPEGVETVATTDG